jgi:5-methylcytosine-specific restriction endonuclease McrA
MRNAKTKTCFKCSENKPISEFYIKRKTKNKVHFHSYCKTCFKNRPVNKEKAAELARKYYNDNPEKFRLRSILYRLNNSEKVKESYKRYDVKRKEKRKLYRLANKEKRSLYNSQWKAQNKDKVNASTQKRRANLLGNGGYYTAEQWQTLKAIYDYRCLICGKQEPEITLTVDHVIPIDKGGLNSIDNIQPLCKSCNSKKGRNVFDLRYWSKDAVLLMSA